MNKLLSSDGSFSGHRGPSKCLKENHSYASLHQFFLEERLFPTFCSQAANERTNPLLLHLQEKRNQTGNPLTKSAKSDSLYMENNSSDSLWRIISSNKSSEDKIACPSWIQGFLGLLLCISSMSFAHTGRVRQHKYCHTDYSVLPSELPFTSLFLPHHYGFTGRSLPSATYRDSINHSLSHLMFIAIVPN